MEARQILDRACDRHGGWERWRRLDRIDLAIRQLTGPLLRLKGLGHTFRRPHRVSIWPHRGYAIFHNYPYIDSAGVFDRGRVKIVHQPVPANLSLPGDSHRASLRGIQKYQRWRHLDAIYFFGYALCHYHALPFALAEARVVRARESAHGSSLTVEFGDGKDTHSVRETVYFDATGLIVRHDYVATVIGAWARGAHEWSDYRVVEGVPIAMRRRVCARIGGIRLPIPVLSAIIGDAAITNTMQA